MEPRVNYILVGIFVIVLTMAAIVVALWLASDIRLTRYHSYRTYFHDSVAGLNPNAPVKYRGVNVGRVEKMRIDPEDPTRIEVMMDIAADTPIRSDTYALLKLQGLTGIAYIELEGEGKGEPLPSPMPDGSVPTIASRSSAYNRLEEALGRAALTVEEVGRRMSRLLNRQNIDSFQHSLQNLEQVTTLLDHDKERFDSILANAQTFSSDLALAGRSLPELMKKVDRLVVDYDRLSREISAAAVTVTKLGERIEETAQKTGQDLQATIQHLDTALGRLAAEISQTAREVRALASRLNDHPNALIYGSPQPELGPGE